MIPEDLRYTKEHEWVKVDGNKAVMGITDHAQSQLGDITFVELPQPGNEVKASDSISTVESVKAASDIYAPVSGKIVEVNSALEDAPEAINSAPYTDGWICKVELSHPSEVDNLMSAAEYKELTQE